MKIAKLPLIGVLTGVLVGEFDGLPTHAATTNLHPVADTTLHEFEPDKNFGGGTTLTAGRGNMFAARARALFRFDIAGRIPAGATINSAALAVRVVNANGPSSTFALQRVLAGWGEGAGDDKLGDVATVGSATWNRRQAPTTSWTSAGGDFAAAASATMVMDAVGSYTFSSAGLAADVQQWLSDPGANFGWVLRSESEGTLGTIRRLTARTDPANPPLLTVDYSVGTLPPANPPTLSGVALIGNQLRFSFNAQAGRTYTIESRDTLGPTNWVAVTNLTAPAADTVIHVTNNVTGTERYFRARTP